MKKEEETNTPKNGYHNGRIRIFMGALSWVCEYFSSFEHEISYVSCTYGPQVRVFPTYAFKDSVRQKTLKPAQCPPLIYGLPV